MVVASAPFGLLFGALAVDNGFTPFEAFLMSASIYGGASQMVGLDLFGAKIAPWLIVLSIFAVNFRHVLYSGAVGRRIRHWPPLQQAVGFFFLVDPQYAESEVKGERGEKITFAWYMSMAPADLCLLDRGSLDRRDVRQPDSRPACTRHRLPAADLFPGPGHGLPRPAASGCPWWRPAPLPR